MRVCGWIVLGFAVYGVLGAPPMGDAASSESNTLFIGIGTDYYTSQWRYRGTHHKVRLPSYEVLGKLRVVLEPSAAIHTIDQIVLKLRDDRGDPSTYPNHRPSRLERIMVKCDRVIGEFWGHVFLEINLGCHRLHHVDRINHRHECPEYPDLGWLRGQRYEDEKIPDPVILVRCRSIDPLYPPYEDNV